MVKKYLSDLRKEFKGYNFKFFSSDFMAGLTVAAVALPLALAFGVSSGADAAAGLITAIIAGLVIGLLSGGSYQISGPTGAMTAILLAISAKFGIQGVFFAGLISGIILILAAVFKVGKLVSFIPTAVITGFTSGIAIIITLGQIDNFFGIKSEGESAIQKLLSYKELGFNPNIYAIMFGIMVLLIMIFYPKKLNEKLPASLAAIIITLVVQLIFKFDVKEVGEIPKTLFPENRLILSSIELDKIKDILSPAFSIAALGMIESLLCGASAGKSKNEKLDSKRELVAQGIGNIIIPFFGGVPATAAIARTSVAIKSGGKTRLVSIIHSLFLILTMFLLGPIMSHIPLSALAGVLVMTAWKMNEWHEIKNIFNKKLKLSSRQFILTMISTVVFDLTIAILIGVIFSMFIFILKSSELTVEISDVDTEKLEQAGVITEANHEKTKLVYLTGPLFFGTQEKLPAVLKELKKNNAIVFSMRGVPIIDDSAIGELDAIYDYCKKKNIILLFCGVQPRVKATMARAGFVDKISEKRFCWDAIEAIKIIEKKLISN
jgi:SulP family sulfate permease